MQNTVTIETGMYEQIQHIPQWLLATSYWYPGHYGYYRTHWRMTQTAPVQHLINRGTINSNGQFCNCARSTTFVIVFEVSNTTLTKMNSFWFPLLNKWRYPQCKYICKKWHLISQLWRGTSLKERCCPQVGFILKNWMYK